MAAKIPAEFVGLEKSAEIAAKKAGRNLKINIGTSARSVEALSQPLGRITGKADEFTKSMEAANARVLAFGASVGVLRSVTNSFKDLVVTTIQVEKQMASINAILGASTGELSKFKKEIFDVARNTEQSFETVATAALELSRQGLAAEEVLKRLNDSLILSRLSGQSSADAVAGLTSAINGFKSAGITSTEVVNKFSEAAKSAAVSERDLAEAFKRAGAVAGQAGVSFDELVGIVSAVQEKTSRGGSVIGNSFKTIFTRIQSLEKLKTMQELGVQVTNASGDILSATQIIQNLAGVLENFPDARRLQIAENLVGKFQVAPFISLLEDYNDETSKAIKITQISANATTAAYERNAALNETLSAAINEARVNVEQLFETLGKIGVTEGLQNVLGFFNTLVENLRGLLDEETGSDIAKGLVKGIGNVISGPGLAIFAAVIGKLTLDLVKFGTGSLKTFFGLNRAAKEQATLQGQIAATLLNNSGIQKQILAIENSQLSTEQKKAAQTKFFTTALNEQLAVMQRMQTIASRVTPGVMAGTRRGRGAGGYIPNFAGGSAFGSEQADINRGVGGAPRSARPVAIPNFNFGGGQRGTMVANTSEFIVPNFGGGSAIFNQNMAASMGLPPGARPVGAAGGYIPNFAIKGQFLSSRDFTDINNREVKRSVFFKGNDPKTDKVRDTLNYKGPDEDIIAARDKLIAMKSGGKVFDADKKGIALLTMRGSGIPKPFTHTFKDPFMGFNIFKGTQFSIGADKKKMGKYGKFTDLENQLDSELAAAANRVVSRVHPDIKTNPPPPITSANIENLIRDEGGPGALEALKGALFESITNAVIGGVKGEGRGTLDIRFSPKNRPAFDTIFTGPFARYGVGDYKSSFAAKGTFARQAIKHGGMRSASGYIPNYASDLENAIGREAAAGLPINQIRINQKGSLRNSRNPMGLAVTNTRDEPTGAIPNFATPDKFKPLEDSAKEVAKANRDMLGTIFAVQMGMSLLVGATSDAESGIGRFVNRLSTGLSTATTGALAGSALTQFGDSFSGAESKFVRGLGKATKGLGILGIAVGAGVGAFQFFKGVIDDATGKTDANALAMAKLTDAAKKAAFTLEDLSEVQKLGLTKEAEDFPKRLIEELRKQNPGASVSLGALDEGTARQQFVNLRAQGFNEQAIIKLFSDNISKFSETIVDAEFGGEFQQDFARFTKDNLAEISDGTGKMMGKASAFFESLKDLTDQQKRLLMEQFGDTEGRGKLRGPRRADIFNPFKEIDPVLLEADKIGLDPTRAIQRFSGGFLESLKTNAGAARDIDRTPIEIAKGFLSRTAQNRLIQQAGTISPEEMLAARGGAGLLFPGQRVGATTALNRFNFEEKAVSNFIDGIADVITKTEDIDTTTLDDPNSPFRRAVDNLMGIKFADIATMEGKQAAMQSFITTANLSDLQKNQLTVIADKIQKQQKGLEIDLASKNANTKLNDELSTGNALLKARISAAEKLRSGEPQLEAATAAGAFDRIRAADQVNFLNKITIAKTEADLLEINQAKLIRDTLIDGAENFSDTIIDGLLDAVIQGKSLGDVLRSAASDFFRMMARSYMQQGVDSIVGGGGLFGGLGGGGGGSGIMKFIGGLIGANSGGMISGGSGTRDDVPALLTGGEFVMRKSSVNKYGAGFMNALNQGAVPRFANGGMFIPGSYGQGTISGKSNLLSFATQSGTSPSFDKLVGGGGMAAVALAPESLMMTNLGRSMSPAFRRTQQAKSEAFGLFVQKLQSDRQKREQAAAQRSSSGGLLRSLGLAVVSGLMFGGGGLFGGRKGYGSPADFIGPPDLSGGNVGPFRNPMGGMIPYMAGGGGVGYAAGVDTVPAMLSGGEFVMNAASTARIGAANLQALNSGASIGGGSNMSITKGDTNISIVVNSDGSADQEDRTNAEEEDKTLATKIKDAVKDVISTEKRLGGMLAD